MKKGSYRLNSMAEFENLKNRNKLNPLPVTNKHHSIITEADGIKFGSKKESRIFRELQARQHNGELKFFLLQVPFILPGKTDSGRRFKHYLDFMAVRTDGQIEYIEVKGRDLPVGKMKRRQVEEIYGINIEVI